LKEQLNEQDDDDDDDDDDELLDQDEDEGEYGEPVSLQTQPKSSHVDDNVPHPGSLSLMMMLKGHPDELKCFV